MDAVIWLEDVGKEDLSIVGGKGASLGEMINIGVPVPGGFAVTAQAFRDFINRSGIADELFEALKVDVNQASELHRAEEMAKKLIMDAKVPKDIEEAIKARYDELCRGGKRGLRGCEVQCHRRGLPSQLRRPAGDYLNMRGAEEVFDAVRKCWASLYGAGPSSTGCGAWRARQSISPL